MSDRNEEVVRILNQNILNNALEGGTPFHFIFISFCCCYLTYSIYLYMPADRAEGITMEWGVDLPTLKDRLSQFDVIMGFLVSPLCPLNLKLKE